MRDIRRRLCLPPPIPTSPPGLAINQRRGGRTGVAAADLQLDSSAHGRPTRSFIDKTICPGRSSGRGRTDGW